MSKSEKNIVAIIQARMGATRLPGKVMMEIDGISLLKIMLSRVMKSKLLDKVIIATSTSPLDNKIEDFCKMNGYESFRGSENDVLSRYYECAKKYNADVIVRLTADCPLIDPLVIDKLIKLYFESSVDYGANTVPPETSTFPDGSDVEVFSIRALEKANTVAHDPKDREHVTFYFWKYNNGFKTVQLNCNEDWSKYRFTVDYPEDFDVIKCIMKELSKRNIFGHLKDIIEIFDLNPEIKQKNEKYYFGVGWE